MIRSCILGIAQVCQEDNLKVFLQIIDVSSGCISKEAFLGT